ncbi:MAG: hypothetical protein V2A58_17945 [Planctomycetota bacterium]
MADRALTDCGTPGLSADGRLHFAYAAALQCACTALAAEGFRPTREAHHYRAIQSLAHTLGADLKVVEALDGFRKKRNVGEYERVGAASDREADELTALADRLRKDIEEWLRRKHPEFL